MDRSFCTLSDDYLACCLAPFFTGQNELNFCTTFAFRFEHCFETEYCAQCHDHSEYPECNVTAQIVIQRAKAVGHHEHEDPIEQHGEWGGNTFNFGGE